MPFRTASESRNTAPMASRAAASLVSRFDSRAVRCPVVSTPIRSLADYFALLSDWAGKPARYWFRGQASADWRLLPSALRYATEPDRNRALALITDFKRVAEIKLPANRVPVLSDDLRWIQVGQHYGLPTRLLDWTESPLVGLHFACCEGANEDGLVFLLDPRSLNRYTVPAVTRVLDGNSDGHILERYLKLRGRLSPRGSGALAINPAWNNERIALQQGVFTLHGTHSAGIRHSTPSLVAIPVMSEAKEALLNELHSVGIDEMSLFPELEHAARQLKRRAQLDPTHSG